MNGGAAVWRPAVKGLCPESVSAEAVQIHSANMATVSLRNVKKVYPNTENKSKKKKEETSSEGKANLQITEEGVVAVQEFNLEIADKEFIVLVGPSGCG